MINQSEVIQYRNIQKVLEAAAAHCFGNQNDPKWGTSYIAVVNALNPRCDGLELSALGLEPLPNVPAKKDPIYYVVERVDGKYLAIDSHSGGYPWWTDSPGSAERFDVDERAVNYINSLSANEKGGGIVVRPMQWGTAISVTDFIDLANNDIRKQALAKLSTAERRALGV